MTLNVDNEPMRILIIGSLPPPVGGTTVSLQYLVSRLGKYPEIDLCVMNTGNIRGTAWIKSCRLFKFVLRLIGAIRKTNVVTLHCGNSSLYVQGIVILVLSRFFQKPLIIRKFNGADYRLVGGLKGKLNEWVLMKANLCLLETRQLLDLAKRRRLEKARWFPNHRPVTALPNHCPALANSVNCRKFVYIGHIRESKGIRFLAEASKCMPNGAIVDVYGPWFEDIDKHIFSNCSNIKYRGTLRPEDVIPTMRKYDALLLPTHHAGEGYPGSILEAYNAGLPVIATRWQAIPEICDESVSILVEPKNANDLSQAIIKIYEDSKLFQQLRANTRKKAEFFSDKHWADEFVKLCRMIVQNG